MRPAMVLALALIPALPARADLARRRSAVVDVVQKVGPAVVFIGTEQVVNRRMRGSPLEEFFFGEGGRPQRQTVQSLGSGVIIDPGGTIVTNDHVIRGASAVHVMLADGRQLDAEVVGAMPPTTSPSSASPPGRPCRPRSSEPRLTS